MVRAVTVVIRCLIDKVFTGELFASLRSQGVQQFVVADDVSNAQDIRRALQDMRAKGAKVLVTKKRGSAHAQDAGTRAAASQFIAFRVADDRLLWWVGE